MRSVVPKPLNETKILLYQLHFVKTTLAVISAQYEFIQQVLSSGRKAWQLNARESYGKRILWQQDTQHLRGKRVWSRKKGRASKNVYPSRTLRHFYIRFFADRFREDLY